MKAQGFGLNGTLGTIKGTYTDGTLFLGKVLVVDGKAISMSQPDVSFFIFFYFFDSAVGYKGACSLIM